jgi:hypothetical protein
MLIRALQAGMLARWVAGDEIYGADPGLRAECEYQRIRYVFAVGCGRRIPATTRAGSDGGPMFLVGLGSRPGQPGVLGRGEAVNGCGRCQDRCKGSREKHRVEPRRGRPLA